MEDREAGQPVVVRWAKEEEWAPAIIKYNVYYFFITQAKNFQLLLLLF